MGGGGVGGAPQIVRLGEERFSHAYIQNVKISEIVPLLLLSPNSFAASLTPSTSPSFGRTRHTANAEREKEGGSQMDCGRRGGGGGEGGRDGREDKDYNKS